MSDMTTMLTSTIQNRALAQKHIFPPLTASCVSTFAYWKNCGAAHPASIGAATQIGNLAPGDLGTVFFVNSGSEAVESAIRFDRQYHRSQVRAQRTKIIARDMAHCGTTLGVPTVTVVPAYKEPFGPLTPGVRHAPNTLGESILDGGSAADLPGIQAIRQVIEVEGGETIATLFPEPVQNSRGALASPEGYWQELRRICDKHGILLVADEGTCGFGRLDDWFGSTKLGVVPDLLTFAEGSISGYAPLGLALVRGILAAGLMEPPEADMFTHGLNRIIDENRSVLGWRGSGFFYSLELTGDRENGCHLISEQSQRLVGEITPRAMRGIDLIIGPDNRGAVMLMLSPPLLADQEVLDDLLESVDPVMFAADRFLGV